MAVTGLVAAVVLGALSGRALFRGSELQNDLNTGNALSTASQTLAPLVASGGGPFLVEQVRQLVRSADLGLTYVAVSDASGAILAVDGRFESLAIPLISALAKQQLRAWLYQFTSTRGTLSLQQGGQVVGEVDYAVAPGYARDVRERALGELRVLAWIGLIVGLIAMAAMGHMLMRKPERADPKLIRRSIQDPPQRRAEDMPDVGEEAEITSALREHGVHALDSLNRALIVVDRDARIRFMNQTAAKITGWPAQEARGRLVYSVFHPLDEQQAPLVTPAESCLREGREYEPSELWVRRRDNTVHAVEVMAALLMDGDDAQANGAAMVFHVIDERRNLIDHLKRQARLSLGVIDHLVEGVFTTDKSGVIRFANARAARMFGYSRESLEGMSVTKMLPVPFLNTPGVTLTDYIGARYHNSLPKVAGWRNDATTFPVELVVQPMSVEGTEGLVVITRDITERLHSDNLAQRLGRLLDSAAEEVYIFDAQSLYFVEVNRGARRNLGYASSQIQRMTPLSISRELDEEQFNAFLTRLRSGEVEHLSYRCRHVREDGSDYPVEVRLNFSGDEEPPMFMAIAVDISERESSENDLRRLAHHDPLTGLPNRMTMMDRLNQGVIAASRSNKIVGVLFVDLDRFKQINDNHGHEMGDAVLQEASQRLSSIVRETDTVARLGGDEFVIVAQGLRSVDDAEALARKVIETFESRFEIEEHKLRVTPSVGVALFPLDESDAEGLLRHADAAMYQAKQSGPGQYRLHNVAVSPDKRRRLDIERNLSAALTLQQIEVEAQIAVELAPGPGAGRASAVLLNFYWQHPRLGRIAAPEVAAAAGRAGLISEFELWMIYCACTLFPEGAEADTDTPPIPVVVNVSGWQFKDPDFYEQVFELMDRHQVSPRRLIFALDSEGISNLADAPEKSLRRLQERGVSLALRGAPDRVFAALNRIQGLSLSLVIMGPEDVNEAAVDEQATERLRLAILAAKGLDVPVLAEGIVSDEGRQWLVTQGARHGAGNLLGEPVPARSLSRELAAPRIKAA